jgi:NADPH2:quinone reductase
MAIQLAKAFGSKVIVTVGSKDKADACLRLGADHAINYKTEDFVAEPGPRPRARASRSFSTWSAATISNAITTPPRSTGVSSRSRLLGGPRQTVNFAKLMVKRLHHTGSTLRPRSNADKAAMVAAIEAKVMPLLREGRIKPLMDSTFPLEKAADAHRRMETSEHIGKIVLAV